MNDGSRSALATTVVAGPPSGAALGRLVGEALAGRYDIVDFVGAGGMGEVYRARDRELDDVVALKVLRADLASSAELLERFRSEVKLARRVTHRSVARTYEFGEAGGVRFITMEYVAGESLAKMLARRGPLGVELCARIALDVCAALDAAHGAGIVHRDIKPDNVIVTASGRAVVTDFGVARLASDDAADASGTPHYMAPEQVRREPSSPATDVYALGVTLFEAATGRLPFVGATAGEVMAARLHAPPPDPRALAPHLSRAFAEVVQRAMATAPAERFESALAMRAALEPLAGRPSMPPPVDVRAPDPARKAWTSIEVRGVERGPAAVAHLVAALHQEMTLRLGAAPRVRLVSGGPGDGADVVLGGAVVDGGARVMLTATATDSGMTLWSARLPLSSASLVEVADEAGRAVVRAIEAPREIEPAAASDVFELSLKARFRYHTPIASDLGEAVALYREAQRLAPDDPRVLAGYAMAFTRYAFFASDAPDSLAEAERAARAALAAAPDRPEPHLAAGHLALHTGHPIAAARHFRTALARAPAWPEAHEWLGRLLLEAGYLGDAIPRLESAMRIDPSLFALRWEVARALALEGRWAEVDQLVAELTAGGRRGAGRAFGRARLAAWRGDRASLARIGDELERGDASDIFDPEFTRAAIRLQLGEPWSTHAAVVLERVFGRTGASVRRDAFYAQNGAELAAVAGEVDVALRCLSTAEAKGLFDLHWLDRCPQLAPLRADARFAEVRAAALDRAQRILDALYGS